jgi:signal transduction histidine kinase
MKSAAEISTLSVFRTATLIACLAVAMQPLARVAWLGVEALPYLRMPMVVLTLRFFDTVYATNLQAAFSAVLAAYVLATVSFMLAFYRRTDPSSALRTPAAAALLGVQIALGLLIGEELLYLVAAEIALVLPWRRALAWWCGQAVAFVTVGLERLQHVNDAVLLCNLSGGPVVPLGPHQRSVDVLISLAMGLLFQALAFAVGSMGAAEQRRSARIAAARAELVATRRLLGSVVKAAERARIARELHDALGHQLTAMNLHLELAQRQCGTAVSEALQAAAGLAQRLAAEVRQLVRVESRSAHGQEHE